jgi:hypothetical protein
MCTMNERRIASRKVLWCELAEVLMSPASWLSAGCAIKTPGRRHTQDDMA